MCVMKNENLPYLEMYINKKVICSNLDDPTNQWIVFQLPKGWEYVEYIEVTHNPG